MATTASTIMVPGHAPSSEAWLAAAAFLARYSGTTRVSYAADLKSNFWFCAANNLDPLEATRVHLELWTRMMEDAGLARATVRRRLSSVAGFYRFAAIDGRIEHSPAEFVRRPKVDWESTTLGLDRMELSAFIAQGAAAGRSTTPWPVCSACSAYESPRPVASTSKTCRPSERIGR